MNTASPPKPNSIPRWSVLHPPLARTASPVGEMASSGNPNDPRWFCGSDVGVNGHGTERKCSSLAVSALPDVRAATTIVNRRGPNHSRRQGNGFPEGGRRCTCRNLR